VAIVDHGRVIALGTIDELKRLVGDENVVTVSVESLPPGAVTALQSLPGVDGVLMGASGDAGESEDGEAAGSSTASKAATAEAASAPESGATVRVLSKDASGILASVVTALTDAGARITAIDVREPDLESVFLHLTGKSLRD
jgi:ABC-2 type transport system ATP-binding protein